VSSSVHQLCPTNFIEICRDEFCVIMRQYKLTSSKHRVHCMQVLNNNNNNNNKTNIYSAVVP